MRKIGLTGGIASGKSTVSKWLLKKGLTVIDMDVLARTVVEPKTNGLASLVEHFGKEILNEDGTLCREKLGQRVFHEEKSRLLVNDILHNEIKRLSMNMTSEAEQRGEKVIVYDVPLLIETGWYKDVDEVWLVFVEEKTQITRLCQRNSYNLEEAKARLQSQMPLHKKKEYSQILIDNNGSEENLYKQLEEIWSKHVLPYL